MAAIKFSVDRSLGKLAKWLRLLGFDTLYQKSMTDHEFLRTLGGGRMAVTRNRKIFSQISGSSKIFIRFNDIEAQLIQIIRELKMNRMDVDPFSRCLRCNERIVPVERITVCGQVPDYVFETQPDFTTCLHCHRIFWPGSHTLKSLSRLDDLFNAV